MTTKRLIRGVFCGLVICGGAKAAPFLAIGDGAELFVTGTLGVRADDNIFLSTDAGKAPAAPTAVIDDVIFDLTPGIELMFGKNSAVKGSITAGVNFSRYSDNSNLDTDLLNVGFSASYDDGKLKLGVQAGFNELNQNSVDIRGLTRRDNTSFNGTGELSVSDKTSIGAGLSYEHANYKRTGYSDSDITTIPLNFYYKVTPKMDLSLGYRYRDTQEQIAGADSEDHFLNVGARGEFTPKLTGSFNVGYNRREPKVGGSTTDLGIDSNFSLAVTPKSSLTLGVTRDFSTTPQGAQQTNTGVNFGASSNISDQLSLNAALAFRAIDYGTRTDDYLEGQLSGTYTLNAFIRFAAAYAYRKNSSVIPSGEFTNNVFSFSASFRY